MLRGRRLLCRQYRNGIRSQGGVRGDKCQAVLKCLSNQHAVKGIAMQRRKCGKMHEGSFLNRQRGNLVGLALPRKVYRGWLRQREFSEGLFNDGFPNRSNT